jgi:hypothetical protein
MLTEDSELFDVRLDGSDLRSLGSGCYGDPFAIPETSWVACRDNGTMMLIDRHDPSVRHPLAGAEGGYSSWTSDGSRVALACNFSHSDVSVKASGQRETRELILLVCLLQNGKSSEPSANKCTRSLGAGATPCLNSWMPS